MNCETCTEILDGRYVCDECGHPIGEDLRRATDFILARDRSELMGRISKALFELDNVEHLPGGYAAAQIKAARAALTGDKYERSPLYQRPMDMGLKVALIKGAEGE